MMREEIVERLGIEFLDPGVLFLLLLVLVSIDIAFRVADHKNEEHGKSADRNRKQDKTDCGCLICLSERYFYRCSVLVVNGE